MRVLLVEDEKTLATYVKRGLEREGYAVDIAADGEHGLWLASNEPFDVIVLDIMLPKLNGFQVCAEIRLRDIWTPILMLTAKDGKLDEAEALDTGADDYLAKPFSFVVLLARLRALIRRGSAERPTVLQVGDLRLNPAQRRLFVADIEVELTPTEFCVLQLFMSRPGDVVSKTEILGSCWDWAYEGHPNIVEVYIRHLRKKIDIPFDRAQIETIRGAGYRLNAHDG